MFFFFDDDAKNDEIVEYSQQTFDSIKHYTEDGQEFWYARDLQKVLEYTEWRNFSGVIEKAKIACQNSGIAVDECFVEVNKTSPMPNGGVKEIEDMMLSRYACYLIVQNGDPRKEIIALGQSYFAVKTRQQELVDDYDRLSEEQKRVAIRQEMKKHNKSLAEAAQNAGVETPQDFAIFQNKGYLRPISLTTWEAQNWQRISSVLPKRMKNFAGSIYRVKLQRIELISKLGERCDRPSKNWVEQCRRISQHQRRVSSRLSANKNRKN